MTNNSIDSSARVYTPLTLKIYDWYVLGLSNRFAWQCPTRKILLPFFQRYMARRHLDVGVGTGFYLANSTISPTTEISLLDLNRNSLEATQQRIKERSLLCIEQDIFQPLALEDGVMFDSISLFYLLHCLPGTFVEKKKVIANLAKHLAPGGVLYGATILGDAVNHNRFGRMLMRVYNQKGIFGNREDTLPMLRDMLESVFQKVEISLHGKVALFTASLPHNI